MRGLAIAGVLLFLLTGVLVGVRLCLLAARTRGLPEFSMGLTLLFAAFSMVSAVIGLRLQRAGDEAGTLLLGFAVASVVIGSSAMAVFNWCVFYRSSRLLGADLKIKSACLCLPGV